jgi:hypothetical protein
MRATLAVYNYNGVDWFWLMKTGNKAENENPVYVCAECGDDHCIVILKKRIRRGEKGSL